VTLAFDPTFRKYFMPLAFADIAFTAAVRTEQMRKGSGQGYAKFLSDERQGGDRLGPDEAAFLVASDGLFQASVSETGWPYVQFRGGPVGFVHVLDAHTIAYADYRGNRQYISAGNLAKSPRVSLIAVDYPNRRRLKIWGEAELIGPNNDPELLARVSDGRHRIERIVKIHVSAIDWNCPQHIPQRFTLAELEPELSVLRDKIEELTTENAALKRAQ
jgi:predicted pyridoxine 5'-phosphate oxidase superfamily flavin-nucleotide-binding protein